MKPKVFSVLAIFFGLLVRADACPVCFQSGGEERWAFYATTVLLTMLPLIMVGTFVYFLKKRSRQLEAEQQGA